MFTPECESSRFTPHCFVLCPVVVALQGAVKSFKIVAMAQQAQQTSDPAQAQGAQIPLQNFHIPNFPPQAHGLQALTLTADIKLDEYQSLLTQPFSVPATLPPSIESLTLELFSLGYPAGFLAELAASLSVVKSLVVYSQLLGGIGDDSQKDAVEMFTRLKGLRALHLLDVFARPGFFRAVAPWVTYSDGSDSAVKAQTGPRIVDEEDEVGEKKEVETAKEVRRGLMFLEINYTTQHGDEAFLSKVPATELPLLIGPGLITLAFNVSGADVTDDPDDPTNSEEASRQKAGQKGEGEDVVQKDGVMTFNKTLAPVLIEALTNSETRPQNLRVLNTTLYTITLADLKTLMETHTGLMVLMVTMEIEDAASCRSQLLDIWGRHGQKLEQVEIVISPSLQFFMAVSLLCAASKTMNHTDQSSATDK